MLHAVKNKAHVYYCPYQGLKQGPLDPKTDNKYTNVLPSVM